MQIRRSCAALVLACVAGGASAQSLDLDAAADSCNGVIEQLIPLFSGDPGEIRTAFRGEIRKLANVPRAQAEQALAQIGPADSQEVATMMAQCAYRWRVAQVDAAPPSSAPPAGPLGLQDMPVGYQDPANPAPNAAVERAQSQDPERGYTNAPGPYAYFVVIGVETPDWECKPAAAGCPGPSVKVHVTSPDLPNLSLYAGGSTFGPIGVAQSLPAGTKVNYVVVEDDPDREYDCTPKSGQFIVRGEPPAVNANAAELHPALACHVTARGLEERAKAAAEKAASDALLQGDSAR